MDSKIENCSICSIINDSKSSPTRLPAREGECPSLAQQCLRQIAKTPTLLQPDQISKLPVSLLEELKLCLPDCSLVSLAEVFREKGIDTKPAWEVLLYNRFGYEYLDWVTPWSGELDWKIGEGIQDPCQLYMSELCEKLTEAALDTYEKHPGSLEKKICGPCLMKFSSYFSLVRSIDLSWKQLSWIVQADTDLTKALKSRLEQVDDLVLKTRGNSKETDSDTVNFIKQLLAGGKLKSLRLDPFFPHKGSCDKLLVDFFSTDESERESKSMGLDYRYGQCASNLMNLETRNVCEANLILIRERIQDLEEYQGDPLEQQEGLQSLCVNVMSGPFFEAGDDLVHFAKLLEAYKSIKRLNYTSQEFYGAGWNTVCAMVGSRRLTHLNVLCPHEVFFVLIAVLFEYYRCDNGISQPMELLSFFDVIAAPPYNEGLLPWHHPIAAVKRLQLVRMDLNDSMVSHLLLLLRYNTALTHLHLDGVEMDVQLAVASVLSAISKHRTLESLTLCNDGPDADENILLFLTTKDEKALLRLLETNPQLKELVLKECKVSQEFVSSDAFLKAVKSHKGLEHLSLCNNKLGTAGVDLLLAISEPQAATSLKRLGLDYCQIPGPELLDAARSISERQNHRQFLQYLSLCHNKVSREERLELLRCFSTCVRLPHIEGEWREEDYEDLFEDEEDEWDEDAELDGEGFGLGELDEDEWITDEEEGEEIADDEVDDDEVDDRVY